MNDALAIKVRDLGKRYRLGETVDLTRNFRETLMSLPRHLARRGRQWARQPATGAPAAGPGPHHADHFWALHGVSFDLGPGEVLGIIGRNGAGKSTLLKILSRITWPTAGSAEIYGRVGSLLEVGTGFHDELTGRENIYLNGAILGMRKQEITDKFDEIVDFSGVEKFLDTPVKRYSSGMRVRLGFAVAAHLEPEVLIIDEVLAVGDQAFQMRCLGKMNEVARSGRTVIFVSHNMAAVRNLCTRAILLEDGGLRDDGPVDAIINRYLKDSALADEHHVMLREHPNRTHGSKPFFNELEMFAGGAPGNALPMGGDLKLTLHYESPKPLRGLRLGISIYDLFQQRIVSFSPSHQDPGRLAGAPLQGRIDCHIPTLNLVPGAYRIWLFSGDETGELDHIENAGEFHVIEEDVFGTGKIPTRQHGLVYLPAQWSVSWNEE